MQQPTLGKAAHRLDDVKTVAADDEKIDLTLQLEGSERVVKDNVGRADGRSVPSSFELLGHYAGARSSSADDIWGSASLVPSFGRPTIL